MDEKVAYWASVLLSALALVLMVTNVAMINSNRNLQAEVSRRQNALGSAVNLSQLNQALVQALAEASVKSEDTSARDLLAAQGITIKANKPVDKSATPDDTKKK